MTHEEIMSQSIEVLDLDVRTYNALKRAGINTIADIENQAEKLEKTIPSRYKAAMGRLSEHEEVHANVSWVENNTPYALPSPAQSETAAIDIKVAEQISETFNYAVLSAELGDYLKRKEEQLKNEYMNFTANCGRIFAEAQEKLANNKNGLFEKWIESMGFKRSTVYDMISIHKFISSEIRTISEQEAFEALPKMLKLDISKPSAPPELVNKVMNGDITTHKEYIALKKELEAAEEQNAVLSAEKEQFHRASKANLEKLNEERERNSELEQQIRELESRPVDVMVQTDADAERKFNETIRKINLDFEKFRDEADKDLADMRNQRNAALDRAEAAEAKLNAPKAESNVKSFVIRMTMDDYDAIIKALSGNAYLKNIIQKAQVLRV